MKTSQLARQLRLIERLHSVRGCTAEQLSLDLEVSRRTVFRDLRSLEDAGIEIRLDPENRYQLEPHFTFQGTKLLDDEVLALALAVATCPLSITPDMAARLDQALGKVLVRSAGNHRERTARVMEALQFRQPDQVEPAGAYGMIRKIITAIADNQRIDITCDSGQTHAPFKPAVLHVHDGPWRLEGRVGDETNLTAIAVRSIVNVQPSNE